LPLVHGASFDREQPRLLHEGSTQIDCCESPKAKIEKKEKVSIGNDARIFLTASGCQMDYKVL